MSETFPRAAIVTGATSGFGRATVHLCDVVVRPTRMNYP